MTTPMIKLPDLSDPCHDHYVYCKDCKQWTEPVKPLATIVDGKEVLMLNHPATNSFIREHSDKGHKLFAYQRYLGPYAGMDE